jgi:hypothetical protein
LVLLLFTTAWNVWAAPEIAAWPPDLGPRLDGAWVAMPVGPNGPVVHNTFNVAQDAQGLRYTTYVEHSQCSSSLWGTFPDATAHSQMIGVTEKTGPTTAKTTMIHYGLKTGGVQEELVYICVTSWEMTLVDEDNSSCTATMSFYLPQQDANHDGLPDPGQKPVLCAPYEAKSTRLKLMPMCEPTLLPPAPPK